MELNFPPLCVDNDIYCRWINDCRSSTSHLIFIVDRSTREPSTTDPRSLDRNGRCRTTGEDESIRKPLEVDSENKPVVKKIMFNLVSPSFFLSFYNNLRHFFFISYLMFFKFYYIYALHLFMHTTVQHDFLIRWYLCR